VLSRELFWGIKFGWLTYLAGLLMFAFLAYILRSRIALWQKGLEEKSTFDWKNQGPQFLRYLISQRLLNEQKGWGVAHLFAFYGFIILFLGSVLLMLDAHIYHFLIDEWFITYKFILNISGLLALIGIVLLFLRRYVFKTVNRKNNLQNVFGIILSFLALVTGFLVEGSRIAINPEGIYGWRFWAFPVYPVVLSLQSLGLGVLDIIHGLFWWMHMLLSFLTIAALGWTRLSHIALAPLNLFHQAGQNPGELREITISEDYFGTENLSDFTKKQLISIDACVSSGQCEINCPAFISGKPLSPRIIMEKLQQVKDYNASLVGDIINEEDIWACTTCGACQQKCPVLSNPVEKIIDLRRYQVLGLGNMPQTMQNAMISMQKRGHPWNAASRSRLDWTKGLDVPIASEKKNFEVLFWVGCTGALVDRNIKVSQAVVKLLQHCGIDFAILGLEEHCTCHMSRRIGDEYLYQELAEKNLSVLEQYTFNTIVTACPHCYHTLKNEYKLSEGKVKVISHAVYLRELIEKGLLEFKAKSPAIKVTYHDPCYYGKINGIYEPPREICKLAGITLIENKYSRENSFCCGGGGGGVWLDDKTGRPIFETRAKQLLENNIELIATACPFCITMLESAINSLDSSLDSGEAIKVQDIAELLAGQIKGQ